MLFGDPRKRFHVGARRGVGLHRAQERRRREPIGCAGRGIPTTLAVSQHRGDLSKRAYCKNKAHRSNESAGFRFPKHFRLRRVSLEHI